MFFLIYAGVNDKIDKMNNETLLAFVDEIGDRGYSKKSSEYFAMAAVIFPASMLIFSLEFLHRKNSS